MRLRAARLHLQFRQCILAQEVLREMLELELGVAFLEVHHLEFDMQNCALEVYQLVEVEVDLDAKQPWLHPIFSLHSAAAHHLELELRLVAELSAHRVQPFQPP